jgi:hypothetical protein
LFAWLRGTLASSTSRKAYLSFSYLDGNETHHAQACAHHDSPFQCEPFLNLVNQDQLNWLDKIGALRPWPASLSEKAAEKEDVTKIVYSDVTRTPAREYFYRRIVLVSLIFMSIIPVVIGCDVTGGSIT